MLEAGPHLGVKILGGVVAGHGDVKGGGQEVVGHRERDLRKGRDKHGSPVGEREGNARRGLAVLAEGGAI